MRLWNVDVTIKLSVVASSQAEAAEAVRNGLRDGRYADNATLNWVAHVEKKPKAAKK